MKVLVENLAKQQLIDIYYYNYKYSLKSAIETNKSIMGKIDNLKDFPYIGRYIPEMSDKHYREIIYRRTRQSGYRIMYYVSEKSNTIYILNIINCKQDLNNILKSNNYFNKNFPICQNNKVKSNCKNKKMI